jgi:hypothetical protein
MLDSKKAILFLIGCQMEGRRLVAVLSSFPHSITPQYVSYLAAAKLGLFVTELDPAMVSIANIRKVLFLVQPRMVVFDPEVGNNRLELLRQSIPELYHCLSHRGLA